MLWVSGEMVGFEVCILHCQLNTAGQSRVHEEGAMVVEQQKHTSHTASAVFARRSSLDIRYATSQEVRESLYNMTPPLCYANPGRPSTANHYRLRHYATPRPHHAKYKHTKL